MIHRTITIDQYRLAKAIKALQLATDKVSKYEQKYDKVVLDLSSSTVRLVATNGYLMAIVNMEDISVAKPESNYKDVESAILKEPMILLPTGWSAWISKLYTSKKPANPTSIRIRVDMVDHIIYTDDVPITYNLCEPFTTSTRYPYERLFTTVYPGKPLTKLAPVLLSDVIKIAKIWSPPSVKNKNPLELFIPNDNKYPVKWSIKDQDDEAIDIYQMEVR